MSALVLDASVAVAWFMPEELTANVQSVGEQVSDEGAVVPNLWPLEVTNILLRAESTKRISKQDRALAIGELARLRIEIDTETAMRAWNATFDLASHFRLTTYDACYLELAQRRQLPLATLDRQLRAAGRKLGIELLGA
jgi:predicted nucleic acid-binding protein